MAKLPKRINTSENNIEELLKESAKKKNATELEIELIKEPKYHDRRYVDTTGIYELSRSIESTKGLITPIVVRKLKDGTYERLIGYRRIKAYKLLKWKTIPAVILENISDHQAILLMITENMQRENLSIYDETLALVDFVAVSLVKKPEEVKKILYRFKNFKNGNLANSLSEEEKKLYFKVEEILEKTGKITVSTLIDRLNKTNVHPLLQKVLSEGKMTFSVAYVLNKIKDETMLSDAIKKAIEQGLSKREAQEYLNNLIPRKKETGVQGKLKMVSKLKVNKLDKLKQKEIDELLNRIIELTNN